MFQLVPDAIVPGGALVVDSQPPASSGSATFVFPNAKSVVHAHTRVAIETSQSQGGAWKLVALVDGSERDISVTGTGKTFEWAVGSLRRGQYKLKVGSVESAAFQVDIASCMYNRLGQFGLVRSKADCENEWKGNSFIFMTHFMSFEKKLRISYNVIFLFFFFCFFFFFFSFFF